MPQYFDLVDVKWGNDLLRARPIKWDKDISAFDFNPSDDLNVKAIEFELTCPQCGQLCVFNIDSQAISCTQCNAATPNPLFANNTTHDHKTETTYNTDNNEINTNGMKINEENIDDENNKIKDVSNEGNKENKSNKNQQTIAKLASKNKKFIDIEDPEVILDNLYNLVKDDSE